MCGRYTLSTPADELAHRMVDIALADDGTGRNKMIAHRTDCPDALRQGDNGSLASMGSAPHASRVPRLGKTRESSRQERSIAMSSLKITPSGMSMLRLPA